MITTTGFKVEAVTIVFNERNSYLDSYYLQQLNAMASKGKVLLIDLEHRLTANLLHRNVYVHQPNTIQEQIELFVDLEGYLSARVTAVVVLGLNMFLGDYKGKTSTDQLENQRLFAFCLAILAKIAKQRIVLVKMYGTSYPRKGVQYQKICEYYTSQIYELTAENDVFRLDIL